MERVSDASERTRDPNTTKNLLGSPDRPLRVAESLSLSAGGRGDVAVTDEGGISSGAHVFYCILEFTIESQLKKFPNPVTDWLIRFGTKCTHDI